MTATDMTPPPMSADRAPDSQIAEALGLKLVDEGYYFLRDKPDVPGPGTWLPVPRYSSDPVAFEVLLGEIAKRGLGPRFFAILKRLVYPGAFPGWYDEQVITDDDAWPVFSAPLAEKAAAALQVLTDSRASATPRSPDTTEGTNEET